MNWPLIGSGYWPYIFIYFRIIFSFAIPTFLSFQQLFNIICCYVLLDCPVWLWMFVYWKWFLHESNRCTSVIFSIFFVLSCLIVVCDVLARIRYIKPFWWDSFKRAVGAWNIDHFDRLWRDGFLLLLNLFYFLFMTEMWVTCNNASFFFKKSHENGEIFRFFRNLKFLINICIRLLACENLDLNRDLIHGTIRNVIGMVKFSGG